MHRRTFMRLAGGSAVLAAAAAGSWAWAGARVFPVPQGAVAAWAAAGQEAEPRRFALAHAILAPNSHNLQPWRADLSVPGVIGISLDPARMLPETDPYNRQITMGLGTFLELLEMAAAARGFQAQTTLFPEGVPGERLDGRRLATVRMVEDPQAATPPLFAEAARRRTDRRAYDPSRPVQAGDIAALAAAAQPGDGLRAGVATGRGQVAEIRRIAREAWAQELLTERTFMESARVLRIGTSEIERHRHGIVIDAPMLVLLERSGLYDRAVYPAPDSIAITSQIAEFDAITEATAAYLWIVTEGNARAAQVAAGRAYMRMALEASARGLALHPNQQALQEYPEVAAHHAAIHELLDAPRPANTVQMLARLGYPPASASEQPPAPRRGLEAHLTG
ncbi:MAG: Acg family FMN-binding oxidoreductase [Rhodosalinus sp.]